MPHWPILEMPLAGEADVVGVRACARVIAQGVGFETQDRTRIATAVSEVCNRSRG